MLRITEWHSNKKDLQFAFDQIEKYDKDVAFFKQKGSMFAVYRKDMAGKKDEE